MPNYTCDKCNYSTKILTHFNKHLKTKKHLGVTKKSPISHQKVTFESPISHHFFECEYCKKMFKYKQGMYRHIKYTCKKNKDEDLKELVRLLNEQNTEMKKQNQQMQKQINKLSTKLQIQQINSNNTIQNNNYNIKLLNYNQTDYSHLTENDYFKCIIDCNHCVKTLIEKVHFNHEKPENKNIYVSNIKNNYIMVYKNGKWQITNRKEQIDDLYEYNEYVLETWYEEYKNKYPDMIKSFERYLNNKEDDNEVIKNVKQQILLILYNNRYIENKINNENELLIEDDVNEYV